jgi:hypothetical protein
MLLEEENKTEQPSNQDDNREHENILLFIAYQNT